MRNIFMGIVLIYTFSSCKNNDHEILIKKEITADPYLMVIEGTMRGMKEPDTLYVFYNKSDSKPSDTFFVADEKFFFKKRIAYKDIWYVTDLEYNMDHGFEFWAEPGLIQLYTSYDSTWYMSSTGSQEQIDYSTFYVDNYKRNHHKTPKLDTSIIKRMTQREYFDKINEERLNWLKPYILKHRDSPLGVMLAYKYGELYNKDYIQIIDTFTANAYILLNDKVKEEVENSSFYLKATTNRLEWKLNDIEDKEHSFSDFNDFYKIIFPINSTMNEKSLIDSIQKFIKYSPVPRNKIKIFGIVKGEEKPTEAFKKICDIILKDPSGIYYNAFSSGFTKRNPHPLNLYFYTPDQKEIPLIISIDEVVRAFKIYVNK